MLWNRELLAKIDAADDLKIAPSRYEYHRHANLDLGSDGG